MIIHHLIRTLLFVSLFSTSALAAKFENSYVSFELPPRWKCVTERTEWVCRSDFGGTSKEAVIILTAKEVGPSDTIQQYDAYLRSKKQIQDAKGKAYYSTIKLVKQVQINGQSWVDGMHLGSEVPYYYTRYLATVKQQIAILITFSAHQRFYTKYTQDFFKAIQSLRVIANPSLLQGTKDAEGAGGMYGAGIGLPMEGADGELPQEPTGASSSKENAIILAIVLAAIGGYFFLKRRKPKNGGTKDPFS